MSKHQDVVLYYVSTSHTCTLGHTWSCIIYCFWRPKMKSSNNRDLF